MSDATELATKAEIARLEALGQIAPDCPQCKPLYDHLLAGGDVNALPMMPRHKAGRRCQSGSRPHCTCDACF